MKKDDRECPPLDEFLAEVAETGDWHDVLDVSTGEEDPVRFLGADLDGDEDDAIQGLAAADDKRQPEREPEKKCGPDISEWFRNEMERHRKNLDQVRANFVPALWIVWVWKRGLSIQYKSMEFKTADCPSGCEHSVWLCGHCMDRSELGNVMLGFWVAYLGFTARVLAAGVNMIGSKKPGEGADNPTDTAGLGLGFAMGVKLRKARDNAATPAELQDETSFCKFFNEGLPWTRKQLEDYFDDAFKNGKIWSAGWSDPFKHITKGKEDCKKCADVWTGAPHPLPSPKPPLQ